MKSEQPLKLSAVLFKIEKNFHLLILEKANAFIGNRKIEMPRLSECFYEKRYFPVQGMYGGFSYWFKPENDTVTLIVQSWSRVVEDSTTTHEVSAEGFTKVD